MCKEKVIFVLSVLATLFVSVMLVSAQNADASQSGEGTTQPLPAVTNGGENSSPSYQSCQAALAAKGLSTSTARLGGSSLTDFVKKRDEIIAERAGLEQKVKELGNKSSNAIPLAILKTRLDELKKLESKTVKSPEDNTRISDLYALGLSGWMTDSDLVSRESIANQLKASQSQLADAKVAFGCVETALSDFTFSSPEQSFKFWMSAIFALLIAAVIAGFYFLSNKDEKVRQSIFTSQTGIQFLTLFSIVIAIILFGITAILEGKELAALLGGLSGYILGKYNQRQDTP